MRLRFAVLMLAAGAAVSLSTGASSANAQTPVDAQVDSLLALADSAESQQTTEGKEESSRLRLQAAILAREGGDREREGSVLRHVAMIQHELGYADAAQRYYEEALAIAREVGNRSGEATALNGIGYLHETQDRPGEALRYYRAALAIQRERERSGLVGGAVASELVNVARVHHSLGQHDEALSNHQEVLANRRASGDRANESEALSDIGWVHQSLEQYAEAIDYYEQALAVNSSGNTERTLQRLGLAHQFLGQHAEAIHYYERALPAFQARDDVDNQALTMQYLGRAHHWLDRKAEAIRYFEAALQIVRESQWRDWDGFLHSDLGRVHEQAGRWTDALRHHIAAFEAFRETGNRNEEGRALASTAYCHHRLGQVEEALRDYHAALAIHREVADRREEGATLTNLGSLYGDLGRHDEALAHLELALSLHVEVGERRQEGSTLNNIGVAKRETGHLGEALRLVQEALGISREIGDRSLEGTTLHNIGAIYETLGRQIDALEAFQAGLAVRMKLGELKEASGTLNFLGTVYEGLGQVDEAIAHYERALSLSREIGDPLGEALPAHNIGYSLLHSLGQPAEALTYFEEALAIVRGRGNSDLESSMLRNIGFAHESLGRPDAALDHYEQALVLGREAGNPRREWLALRQLGDYHRRMAGSGPRDAVAYYDSAAVVQAAVAQRAGADQHRLSFAEQDAGLFPAWSLAWLDLAPEVGERTATLSALAAIERGRAQALLDLMRDPDDIAAREPPAPGADLEAEGRALLRAVGDNGAWLLSYTVASDTLLLFAAAPDGAILLHRAPLPGDTLAAWTQSFRRGLAVDGDTATLRMFDGDNPLLELAAAGPIALRDWEAAGQALGEALLPAAVMATIPGGAEVVVVPHGALNLLPFAALPLPSGETLAERVAIRYTPSLAALAEAGSRPRAGGLEDALIVGNPTMPVVESWTGAAALKALDGAEAEARSVAVRVGAELLHGDAATETAVRTRLPAARLVHLATHGYAYASETRARETFIALAPDPRHDGLLTVGEVLDEVPRLSAELIVLSACQTGLGDLKSAEGTVGLQRAFLAKGARTVLVSQWNVDDQATAYLMERFYFHWLDDERGKAEALRLAQADVRAWPLWQHPRYWAAFQLVGAP